MLDELVRPANAHDRRRDAGIGQMVTHDTAVAASEHVILDGDDHLRGLREKSGGAGIDRFRKAGVDDRRVDVVGTQFRDGLVGVKNNGNAL